MSTQSRATGEFQLPGDKEIKISHKNMVEYLKCKIVMIVFQKHLWLFIIICYI